MNLSEHFTLAELTRSEAAARRGIDNTPPDYIISNLRVVAVALEKVRSAFGGRPVRVLSGYRTRTVNAAVGGSLRSAHMEGLAVDFIIPGVSVADICRWCAENLENYDQVIYEFGEDGWCHLGLSFEPRRQTLTASEAGGMTVYTPGIVT